MPNTPKTVLRREIYRLLISEHKKPSFIAKYKDMRLSTVLYHISVLERENAIIRIGQGVSLCFSRGPEYPKYETMTSNITRDGTVEKPQIDTLTSNITDKERRVDTAWFKCLFVRPWPEGHIWWDKEYKWGAVTNRVKRVYWDKFSATITAYDQTSIQYQLEPFPIDANAVSTPEDIKKIIGNYAYRVRQIAEKLMKAELSLPELTTEPYVIKDIPQLLGMDVGTIPISPDSHIDSSKRKRRPHYETKNLDEAVADLQMPLRILALEKSHLEIKSDLKLILQTQEATVRAMEKMTESFNELVKLFKKLTEKDEDKPVKPMDSQDNGAYR